MSKSGFRFSVTELADFACRQGDLAGTGEGGPSAMEGVRGHQWLQSKRLKDFSDYQSEVTLELQSQWNDQPVQITGRIDGLYRSEADKRLTVEEIKTTYLEPELLPLSTTSVQLGQLKLYAWMLVEQNGLDSISATLTWLKLPEYQQYSEQYVFHRSELFEFAQNAISCYCRWLEIVNQHKMKFVEQCRSLEFPYSNYRPWQRELCVEIYKRIRDEQSLLFEAPTGVGKSISTLFPAFKAIGEGKIKQIVFLTAKTSGRKTAVETCQQLQSSAKVLVINARDKTCFCSVKSQVETDDSCEYRIGYYERLRDAMWECFDLSVIEPDSLSKVAQQYKVCPFSLTLAMIPWVDVIVADYNYVFDPLVAHPHLSEQGKSICLLVDEAHNLIDRSRQMYSASFDEVLALNVINESASLGGLTKDLNGAIECMMLLEKQLTDHWQLPESAGTLMTTLADNTRSMIAQLIEFNREHSLDNRQVELLRQLIRFASIIDSMLEFGVGHQYACFLSKQENNLLEAYQLALRCLNAARFLQSIYDKFNSCILFSGTLTPEIFIRSTLGLHDGNTGDDNSRLADFYQLPSPYRTEQQGVFISSVIDIRYAHREKYIDSIVDVIHKVRSGRKGKYMACFSSYQFLGKVAEAYQNKFGCSHLAVQQPSETNEQRQAFIQRFFETTELLGFVILGGSYTEGIDFTGDALHGVIVVGTGLPQLSKEQDAIKHCFDQQGLNGFDMAYRFPGWQRVLQTAGRVIRSENDKGVVVLLDKRFCTNEYRAHFPPIWQPQSFHAAAELEQKLKTFWCD